MKIRIKGGSVSAMKREDAMKKRGGVLIKIVMMKKMSGVIRWVLLMKSLMKNKSYVMMIKGRMLLGFEEVHKRIKVWKKSWGGVVWEPTEFWNIWMKIIGVVFGYISLSFPIS